jgi:hypothetical protein
MKTIHKYRLYNTIALPEGAQVLTVQLQEDEPYLWALVDDFNPFEKRNFQTVGTGWDLEARAYSNRVYIATFQQNGFVWHVFEILK